MATYNKYSRLYFIIGLLLGLIIGIYASFRYIKRRDFSQGIPIIIQNEIDTTNTIMPDKVKKKPIKKTINTSKKNTSNIKIPQEDSLNKDTIYIDSLELQNSFDTSYTKVDSNTDIKLYSKDSIIAANIETDTLKNQVLDIGETPNSNDIHIAKEELIYTIYIQPEGNRNNFLCSAKNNNHLDSVLVNNIHTKNDDGLYVEFWRSPINFTGYKLSQKTLVLYGIYQYTSVRLKYLQEGVLELNYLDNSYKLKCTDDFISINLKSDK